MKVFLIALCGVMLLPTAAFADHEAEMIIAYQYADQATYAATIDAVHANLHQAMNCLVGPRGKGFDIKYGNPCAKAGIGGLPDAPNADMQFIMQTVVTDIRAGLAANDLKKAQNIATEASLIFSDGGC